MAYTTIPKPTDYFNTNLWTGTGSTQTITTGTFQPDFSWIKNRSRNSYFNLIDAVRGATKQLATNGDYVESTDANQVSAFTSTGFTVGTGTNTNASGENIVAWNWKANGSGSANGDGSINSTVSANTTSGFSVVKYTGTGANATVGHGLGVVPNIVLVKSTSNGEHWCMYNSNLGNTSRLLLNLTNAVETSRSEWQSTTPTSSVFSLDGSDQVNGSGSKTYVAYCFADVQGFSKMGSYVGNNNADGTFVYLGFKPSFVLFKRSSATENWSLYDNKRNGLNVISLGLRPNITTLESAYGGDTVDYLSNGFKIRNSGSNINDGTYIYMAFAEEPLVSSNGIPATAR